MELLGVDTDFTDVNEARQKICIACAKQWSLKNAAGQLNFADCSGFVKSVQKELRLEPFQGDANSIYDEFMQRSDWEILGEGDSAAPAVLTAVKRGRLTIAAWKNAPGQYGHVMVITGVIRLLGSTPARQTIGAWGQIGSVGDLFGRLSMSFGKAKHPKIRYAASNIPII